MGAAPITEPVWRREREERALSSSTPPGLWYLLVSGLAAVASVALHGVTDERGLLIAFLLASGLVVSYAAERALTNGRIVLEPLLVLSVVFFIWHFAFWAVYFVGLASEYRVRAYFSIEPELMLSASLLCVAGLAALIGGIRAGTGSVRWSPYDSSADDSRALHVVALAGAALVSAYFVIRGHGLVGRYDAVYLEADPARRLYNLGVTLVLVTLAPILLIERSRLRRWAVVAAAVVPVAVVSSALGSRWVLFTAAALLLSAISMLGKRVRYLPMAALAVLLVVVGVVVKEVRRGELQTLSDVAPLLLDRHTNPIVELPEELGQTILPVAGALAISSEESYLYGSSFAAAAVSVFPSGTRLFGLETRRPGHELAERYFAARFAAEGYTIGYSIVAELQRNFGVPGVPVALGLLGYFLGRVYRRLLVDPGPIPLFALFALCAILMFGMRNDAFTWFRNAVWAIGLLYLIGHALERRRAQRAQTARHPR